MRIAYVADMRMPSERAHGLQAMHTCAALAAAGAAVTFYHPWRRQSPALRGADPFAYYGLEPTFRLRRLPHFDPHLLQPVPHRLLAPAFIGTNALLGLTAALAARLGRHQVVFTRHLLTAWWSVRLGVPTAVEVHQADTEHVSGRVVSMLARLARRPALRLVVCISQGLAERMAQAGVPRSKLLVLPDAVDLGPYAPARTTAEARAHLGLPLEGALIAYTGQLLPSKGADVLVRAAAQVPGASVLLVGGNEDDRSRLRALAASVGAANVRFVPQVPPRQVAAYQQAADVLVLPQLDASAQSPMKLYEYLAAGRPVVASDLPAIREVLTHGESALLTPPGEPAPLAGAARLLLSDPALAQRLAQAGLALAARCTWDARAQGLLSALERVL